MFPQGLLENASALLSLCRARGITLVTAESCTGGLIMAALTEIAGSSDVVERGFITYANEAKCEVLGVDATLIAEHGAVSAPVARAMAEGALQRGGVGISISVTGIAGPTGGTASKPVGLVYIAVALSGGGTQVAHFVFAGSRSEVRQLAVGEAIRMAIHCLQC